MCACLYGLRKADLAIPVAFNQEQCEVRGEEPCNAGWLPLLLCSCFLNSPVLTAFASKWLKTEFVCVCCLQNFLPEAFNCGDLVHYEKHRCNNQVLKCLGNFKILIFFSSVVLFQFNACHVKHRPCWCCEPYAICGHALLLLVMMCISLVIIAPDKQEYCHNFLFKANSLICI